MTPRQIPLGTDLPQIPGEVVCLGRPFANEDARREWYRDRLREKLQESAFRAQPGFPVGSAEAIVAMSDPPWYTACPNPWVGEFIAHHGRAHDPDEVYRRDPFAVDVIEKKSGLLYQAHGYHTKVPYLAILPLVLHYTKPGDIILDGFCGSGMAGVAAQWCATDDVAFREGVKKRLEEEGWETPVWGARRAVLNDLSPAATFIAANYNLPFDTAAFRTAADALLDEVDAEIGWMYRTRHSDSVVGTIEYTVWSEVFQCPSCSGEIVFTDEALDEETKRVRTSFECPHCQKDLDKDALIRVFETSEDPYLHSTVRRVRFNPVLLRYSVGEEKFEKKPDALDLVLIKQVSEMLPPTGFPTLPFPIKQMAHGSRLEPKGITHVHHLFLPRARHALALMWKKADAQPDTRLRLMLRFLVEQAIWGMSLLARYVPTHYSQVNQQLTGVYYVPSLISEVSPRYNLGERIGRLVGAFSKMPSAVSNAIVTTGTCAALPLPDASIDYIFTDPPFGENIYYADLNFLVESFHRVVTDAAPEAIVDRAKKKSLVDYQELMTGAFREYHRVLKPGRWMTVEFHNQHNHVWHAIQEAMTSAGFIVSAVRTFDKAQRSYRQVTSDTVQLDLLVTAYRPAEALEIDFRTRPGDPARVWEVVDEHLRKVPKGLRRGDGTMEVVEERTAAKLFDQVVSWYVQRNDFVPLSLAKFRAELDQQGGRYSVADGMYFLPEQVPEYQRVRAKGGEAAQLPLMPSDEASTMEWLRRELTHRPQRLPDLTTAFQQHSTSWRKHEHPVELIDMLNGGFLKYEGGAIPPTMWAWMSRSATLRERMKDVDRESPTPALVAHARDLWYVPDPDRESDLAEIRRKRLVREFATYLDAKKKLRRFRTEVLRAGYEQAWKDKDYGVILAVSGRIPDEVLAEDPRLLKLLNMARTRAGKGAA